MGKKTEGLRRVKSTFRRLYPLSSLSLFNTFSSHCTAPAGVLNQKIIPPLRLVPASVRHGLVANLSGDSGITTEKDVNLRQHDHARMNRRFALITVKPHRHLP